MEVRSERVDDIPLLLSHIEKLGIAEAIDRKVERHGLRQGLSVGEVASVWLSYILSQGDHRKSYLEGWIGEHRRTLGAFFETRVEAKDGNDDRLGEVLECLSDDEVWSSCESWLNAHTLRVYELRSEVVRCDSTTASSYGSISEDGLLQFGYSQDHRPDLPQVKVATSTLDPLGMPLATLVVSGEQADDPYYQPLMSKVRHGLDKQGLLFVGDSKMGARKTRAGVVAAGDYYLCPLSKVQLKEHELRNYLAQDHKRIPVYRETISGQDELVAEGFEVLETCANCGVSWQERRLLVRSPARAKAATQRLTTNLEKAKAALDELLVPRRGKSRPRNREELDIAVAELLEELGVEEAMTVEIEEVHHERPVRGYGKRPSRLQRKTSFVLHAKVDEAALEELQARLGWQVLATNQSAEVLSFPEAVGVYRDAYRHEWGYSRLKGRPLSLTPMYLQRDSQIKGLVRLLSLALRVLTVLEFMVRRELSRQNDTLAGLYAGNPKRATARPSAELLLYAFRDITLSIVRLADREIVHLPTLSPLQVRILQLSGFDESAYLRLQVIEPQRVS